MSDGFEVDPSELTTHAHTLSAIADGVAECRAASDQEGVGGLVYGVLFDPTAVPLLELARGDLAHLISAAAGVGQAISGALGGNADSYTSIDDDAQRNFRLDPGLDADTGIDPDPDAGANTDSTGCADASGCQMSDTGLVPDEESSGWFSGAGVLSDLATLYGDKTEGAIALDWSIDGVSTGIDTLVSAYDPFGAAISAGVGWLLNHVPEVKDRWNDLAGNPAAIQQAALTWANISTRLADCSADFGRDAKTIESWQGAAADSFRQAATDYELILAGISTDAEDLSICITGMGCIVAALREVVCWLIAGWLQEEVIPEALAALASSWFTFGASLAMFLAALMIGAAVTSVEIGNKVAVCAAKLAEVYSKMGELIEKAAKAAEKAAAAKRALDEGAEKAAKGSEGADRAAKPAEGAEKESVLKRAVDDYGKRWYADPGRGAIDQVEERQKAQDRQP